MKTFIRWYAILGLIFSGGVYIVYGLNPLFISMLTGLSLTLLLLLIIRHDIKEDYERYKFDKKKK